MLTRRSARPITPDEKYSLTSPSIFRSRTSLSFFREREQTTRAGIMDVVNVRRIILLAVVVLAAMVPAALASGECMVERIDLSPDEIGRAHV